MLCVHEFCVHKVCPLCSATVQVISQPMAVHMPELKAAAKQLGIVQAGIKAELVIRILQDFGLERPCTSPAAVVRFVHLEKLKPASQDLRDAVRELGLHRPITSPRLITYFSARRKLAQHCRTPDALAAARVTAQALLHERKVELIHARATHEVLTKACERAKRKISELEDLTGQQT